MVARSVTSGSGGHLRLYSHDKNLTLRFSYGLVTVNGRIKVGRV